MRSLSLILMLVLAGGGHGADQAPRPPQAPPSQGCACGTGGRCQCGAACACAGTVGPATVRVIHDGTAYDVPAGYRLVLPGQSGYATARPARRALPPALPWFDGSCPGGNCRR